MRKNSISELNRSRTTNFTAPKKSKSRISNAIKNLKQLSRPEGKFLITDGRYIDFADLMTEEDFAEPRYKEAAKKYQKLIKLRNYEDISMYEIGLDPAIDEELDIMMHLRFIYG